MCQCFCFSGGKPAISLCLKWHILSTLHKENNKGVLTKHPRARRRASEGSLRATRRLKQHSVYHYHEAEKSLRTHFMISPSRLRRGPPLKTHHACRKRSLDRHYFRVQYPAAFRWGRLQWTVMNSWWRSEMEMNSPAVRHTSVCSPPRLTLQLFQSTVCLTDRFTPTHRVLLSLRWAKTWRYTNTSLRLSLEDTVDTSKPDGPRGEYAHLFAGGTKRPAKLFLDEGKYSKTTMWNSFALVSQ